MEAYQFTGRESLQTPLTLNYICLIQFLWKGYRSSFACKLTCLPTHSCPLCFSLYISISVNRIQTFICCWLHHMLCCCISLGWHQRSLGVSICSSLCAASSTRDPSLPHSHQHWLGVSGSTLNSVGTLLQVLCSQLACIYWSNNKCISRVERSVVGPILFSLYNTPLRRLLYNHSMAYQSTVDW